MVDVAKMEVTIGAPPAADDITIGTLLSACDANAGLPLVFSYDGRAVKAGYHVTEAKAGQFAALDCGGSPEAWSEIFIQLWDVIDGNRTHMTAGKFAAIIRKVSEHVSLAADARLTFEVSDGVAPMQLHYAASPIVAGGVASFTLSPRASSCKPRDRWLEEQRQAVACCNSSGGKQPCC